MPARGAYRHRHDTLGAGCDGRGVSKGEWFCCVRSSRVVLAPRMLAKSSWEARFSGATVTTSSLHREEHEVSRNTIAQGMSECFRSPVCSCAPNAHMLVCAKCAVFGTRDRGCSVHPAFPAPSLQERDNEIAKPGRKLRREIDFCRPCDPSTPRASPG